MRAIVPFPMILRVWVKTADNEFSWSQKTQCTGDLAQIDSKIKACMLSCESSEGHGDAPGAAAVTSEPAKAESTSVDTPRQQNEARSEERRTEAAATPQRMVEANGSVVHAVLDPEGDSDSDTTQLYFAAIRFENIAVGLAFRRTYWSFNYVNTAYVALFVIGRVLDQACTDEGDITYNLRLLTADIDGQFVHISNAIMARWPPLHAESLDLIAAQRVDDVGLDDLSAAASKTPQFELSQGAIEALESLKSYSQNDVKLFPIGVVGNLREGKSTLQNMLMQLYAIEVTKGSTSSDGERAKTEDIRGASPPSASSACEYFKTSANLVSETHGANCYVLPHFRSQKTWMVFVDFEGFGDPEKQIHYCSDYDVRLFAIAIAMLKCMLYNTKSAVDHYVIDRLKALKYVADNSLLSSIFHSVAGGSRRAPAASRPSVFLVLRDFALHTVDRSTKSAVEYYKKLLFSESKESSAFLKERFERLEVHPVPKPIDTEEIHYVSQLPLAKLTPEFQVAIKHLAKDTGFWAEDSQLGSQSSTSAELDTFQGFTNRVKTAIMKVNASTSQPLMMTSVLARQAVESVVCAMESRVQIKLSQASLPLTDDALDAMFTTTLEHVYSHFTLQMSKLTKVSGNSSLQMVISDAWGKVKDKANRERSLLEAENEREAHAFAGETCKSLMAGAPPKDQMVHPTGSEDRILAFMNSKSEVLRMRLTARCPDAITEQHVHGFYTDLMHTYELYVGLNTERRHAERQRAAQQEEFLKNEERMRELLSETSDQASQVERLSTLTQELNQQLAAAAREHEAKLLRLADENHHGVQEAVAGTQHRAEVQLAEERGRFEAQIKTIQEKFDEQQNRANDLQRHIDDHRCRGGCLPGNTLMVTQSAGVKQLKDVEVGESILVASAIDKDGKQQQRFERIGGFFDHEPRSITSFVTIEVEGVSDSVSLTASHLIWCKVSNEGGHPEVLQASKIAPGMFLVDARGELRRVESVQMDDLVGVFSPFVPGGSFIANGVVVSAYAKPLCLAALPISDMWMHHLCHVATYLIRVAAQWATSHEWESTNKVICRDGTKLLKRVGPAVALVLGVWVVALIVVAFIR